MNFYPFHLGDYASATKGLTLLEDLAYRRLIDLYYMSEAPIPDDIDRVSRLIGMRENSEIISYILSEFFVKSEGCFRHSRCDQEIAKYHAKAARARKANDSRWNSTEKESEKDLKSDADQIPTKNQDQEPITKTSVSTRIQKLPDQEWIESLKSQYTWLDVATEIQKMKNWIAVNPQRKLTRKFIINWLNRIEKPVNVTDIRRPNKYAKAF